MKTRAGVISLLIAAAALAYPTASVVAATDYTIIDLGTLPGGTASMAWGINDSGQIVGWSGNAGGSYPACLWQNGATIDLGAVSGGTWSHAKAISNSGQIVGWSGGGDVGYNHACLWQDGTIADLGTLPGSTSSEAWDVNGAREIVGGSQDASAALLACVWQDGTVTNLGTLSGDYSHSSWASAVNDAGQVVGWSGDATAGIYHACVWRNGAIADLGTLPGGTASEAIGINGMGQIVGWSADAGGYRHACLWQDGAIAELGTLPGDTCSAANGINDAGQIVGWSVNAGGDCHACLWQDGAITDLGTLSGGTRSEAWDINGAGQIVGQSRDAGGNGHACLWEPTGVAVLSVALFADCDAASPVGTVTFTLSYDNRGSLDAMNAVLTDTLDPLFNFISATDGGTYDPISRTVTWSLGDLPSGASGTVGLTVQVSDSVPIGTHISNEATVDADNANPVSSNVVEILVAAVTVEPLRPTSFWDVSYATALGGDLSFGLDLFGAGADAGTFEAAGTCHMGCRYELQHGDAGDVLTIHQVRGGGLELGGELGSLDAVVISGDLASLSGEAGYLLNRSYTFDRAFGDTLTDAEAWRQDRIILLLYLDSALEMSQVHDPIVPAVITFVRDQIDPLVIPQYREAARTEFTGKADFALGEIRLGSGSLGSIGMSVPLAALYNGELAFSLFSEEYAHPAPERSYHQERGVTRAWSSMGPTLVTAPLVPAASDIGAVTYGLDLNDDGTRANYFLESKSQDVVSAFIISQGIAERRVRYDIPLATFHNILPDLVNNPVSELAAEDPNLLGCALADLADGFRDADTVLKSYSADQGDVPVATYTRGNADMQLCDLSVTLKPGGSVGAGAHLKIGVEFQGLIGQDADLEEGQIRNGGLVPTLAYASPVESPAYPPTPEGFANMMASICEGALRPIWESFLGTLADAWGLVAAGADVVIEAAQTLVGEATEGATKLYVHGPGFGQAVAVHIYSTAADVGSAVFNGSAASAPRVPVPYRATLSRYELQAVSTPTSAATLTLVGRVHLVTVEDDSGTPVDSFPPGAMDFESTATAKQLQAYGFTSDRLASVRLYHFLPDSVSWAEVPLSSQNLAAESVTVTAELTEAGEYALGIVDIATPSRLPSLANMTPLAGQLFPGPEVHLEAVFIGTDLMDASATRVEVDGNLLDGVATTLSNEGLFLDVSADAALPPGPHRLKIWVADISGRPGFASVTFYIARENTFPDVLPDFWAWRQVEATKLAGVVQGYPDGLYHPEYAVTRDQMAVYMSRALAGGDAYVPTGPATATFDDVSADHWAFKYVEYCYAHGVVEGYDATTYAPDAVVDRAQMAVYVARAVAGGDGSVPDGPETATFNDVPTDYWAYKYVEYCKANGIVQGYDPVTYGPEVEVTRDQMAVYVARAFALGG